MAVFGVLLCKLWGLIISPDPLPFTTGTVNKRKDVILVLPALASARSLFYTDCKSITFLSCPVDKSKVLLGALNE